jgi:hypothetical protein
LNNIPYKSDERTIAWVSDSIDACKAMGCRVVLLAFFGNGDLKGDKAGTDEVVRRLKDVAPKAEKAGVILGIESWLSAEEHVDIIDRVGSPAVQVYYDVANSEKMGYDIYREIRWLGGQEADLRVSPEGERLFVGPGPGRLQEGAGGDGRDRVLGLDADRRGGAARGGECCPVTRRTAGSRGDFADGLEDVVEVGAIGQEQVLGDGDGGIADLAIAFELLETVAVGFEPLGAPEPFEPAGGDRFVEQALVVLLAIDPTAGNAFGRHGFGELIAREAVEMGGIIAERIEMPDRATVFREPDGGDAGDLGELAGEVIGALTAEFGFLDEFVELQAEEDGLGLGHAVVIAAREVAGTLECARGAAAVVVGIAAIDEFLAEAGDGAAFAGGEVFGFLEAETAEVAEDTAFAAMIFGEPGLAGVLDHREVVLAGDGVDGIHVAGHAEDMHRHERPGAVGDAAGDRGGVDGERGRVGIGEHRQGVVGEDGVVRGDEGVGETMTSSPASTSMTWRPTMSAVVPLAVARQRLAPSSRA